MGKTHARQGVLAGVITVTAGATFTLYSPLSPALALAVIMLVVGAAVVPDIDHPEATVAHTFGPASHAVSRGVNAMSSAIYSVTRSRRDQNRDGGHRGVTHTLMFASGVGTAAYYLIDSFGLWAAAGILFVLTSCGLRGLAGGWAHRHGWLFVTNVAGAFTGVSTILAWSQPIVTVAWWFAVAIIVGCLTHLLGDCVTRQGVPIFWPIPLRGQRWRMVGTPKFMRFTTAKDSWVELLLGRLALILAALWVAVFTVRALVA